MDVYQQAMQRPVKFNWRMIQGSEQHGTSRALQFESAGIAIPDPENQLPYALMAEKYGMHSLLVDISYGKPDPLLLSAGIAMETSKINFLVAVRSGLLSPTLFTQMVNTFSHLTKGRLMLNVVAGHSPEEQGYYGDFLPHDERYARTEEFLAVCHKFWDGQRGFDFNGKYFQTKGAMLNTDFASESRKHPEIFIAGGSPPAKALAIKYGTLWMRLADTPEKIKAAGREVLEAGKEIGLRLSIICRPTKEEAIDAAYDLLKRLDKDNQDKKKEHDFIHKSDSVGFRRAYEQAAEEWLTPWLWTGAVRAYGAPTIAFVGTPEEIADAIMAYKRAGVTQYILSGWPKVAEMKILGEQVMPIVREKEMASYA